MTKKETGGAAFPIESGDMRDPVGMTLLDYFAAKALQGLLADSESSGSPKDFAERAYRFADAMLVERSR